MESLDAKLWSASYSLSMPLRVPLENGSLLVCEEVVRAMPGRRYVCRGVYDGKAVFIKLFSMSNKSKREWHNEQQGIDDLKAAGISAPEIIFAETLDELNTRIIVFVELLGAESAKCRWQQGNETARQMLLMQLVELMAQHHAAGIRQSDCHLLNFVFSEDVLYTLDAADIVKSAAPLSRNDSMDGLADMQALFAIKYDVLLPSLYEYYWQCRKKSMNENELRKLLKKVIKLRQYKLRKYLHKIYRSCSEFVVKKSWHKISIYRRDTDSDSLNMLVENPDKRSLDSQYSIIKDGNTCTVSLIETADLKVVCKRYNIKNTWHGLMRAFRASRASRSWRNAHRLKRLFIATPQPYALIEQRFGPIRRKAWFLMPYLDGISAHDFFRDGNKMDQQHTAVSQFSAVFCKMVEAQLSHGDMKAMNFIFSDNELFVLDLDSMRQHSCHASFAKAFRIDMQRFMRNWSELPDVAAIFTERLSTTVVAEFLPKTING